MPMGIDLFESDNDPWEGKEQLYLMEVVVDKVKVNEDNALASPNPVLPSLIKIQFANFPVMSIEVNDYLLNENLAADDSSTETIEDKLIKGLPDEWFVKKAGKSHYSVEIPLISRPSLWNIQERNTMKVLVPKVVVAAGEGLKYIFATLKTRGEEEILKVVEEQITEEFERMKAMGETKVITHHKYSSVLENEEIILCWDKAVLTDRMVRHNRPDIIIVEKQKKKALIVDIAVPNDSILQSTIEGKSCLFCMKPGDLLRSLEEIPLKIQVYRSCFESEEFVHTLIGEASVSLGLPFTKAILIANTPVLLPVAAQIENVFTIKDTFGREAGSISLFARLSCFGESGSRKDEEDEEERKQQFLKKLFSKAQMQYSFEEVDLKYPWKRNLNAVKERPAPKPRLQPMYDPFPPPPPPPVPPFDMGEYLPDLPRCSPLTPPPCYRRAGDPPLSRCDREMQNQLRREELSKGAQTEPMKVLQPYNNYGNFPQGLAGGSPEALAPQTNSPCTCLTIPPELRPEQGPNQKVECTCAALMKTLGTDQKPLVQQTPASCARPPLQVPRIPEPPVLGPSDYEINLTKIECGLEKNKEEVAPLPEELKEPSKPFLMTSKGGKSLPNIPISKNESEEIMPESVQNLLKEEVIKHNEAQKPIQVQETQNILGDELENQDMSKKTLQRQEVEDDFDIFEEDEEIEIKKEKNVKKSQIYVQTAGMYPGRHAGHKHCVVTQRRVPKTMGWLWTAVNFDGLLKAGRGWRPGSIRKDVNNMMNSLRVDDSEEEIKPGAQPLKRFRPYSAKSTQSKKPVEKVKHSPTLHIHKKEGYIYVSMIPTKTDSQEEAGEEPKPIQFKIDPRHPDGVEDGESCYGSSTSSDVKSYEMDFTAPIALKKRKRKIEKTTMATQYNELDFVKKTQKKPKSEPEPPPKSTEGQKKGKDKGKKGGKGKKK